MLRPMIQISTSQSHGVQDELQAPLGALKDPSPLAVVGRFRIDHKNSRKGAVVVALVMSDKDAHPGGGSCETISHTACRSPVASDLYAFRSGCATFASCHVRTST
jgi:hypothetical protein